MLSVCDHELGSDGPPVFGSRIALVATGTAKACVPANACCVTAASFVLSIASSAAARHASGPSKPPHARSAGGTVSASLSSREVQTAGNPKPPVVLPACALRLLRPLIWIVHASLTSGKPQPG